MSFQGLAFQVHNGQLHLEFVRRIINEEIFFTLMNLLVKIFPLNIENSMCANLVPQTLKDPV